MIAWLRRQLFLWRVRRILRKSAKFVERVRRDIDALPLITLDDDGGGGCDGGDGGD